MRRKQIKTHRTDDNQTVNNVKFDIEKIDFPGSTLIMCEHAIYHNKTRMTHYLLIVAITFLLVPLSSILADDADQSSTVAPISQFQQPDTTLPSGVSYQKWMLGEIISKMFRQDNKKIATAFLHPFHVLMQWSNSGRIPVWDGTAGNNYLVPGTIRDNPATGLVGIGGMPTVWSGTLQIIGPGWRVSSNQYCDENGVNCFTSASVAVWGSVGGSWTPDYLSKFTATGVTIGNSMIYDTGTNVGIGTTNVTQKLTVNGSIAIQALSTIFMGAQSLYGDNSSTLYFTSNDATQSQIILRDVNLSVHGRLYGTLDGNQFGLVDADHEWTYQAVKDQYTALVINNSEKLRLFSGGTVSIGHSTIGQKLDVTGNIKASGSFWWTSYCNTTGAGCATATELSYLSGVSSAVQTQLNAKAPTASPSFSGNPTAPTPPLNDNDTSIATTAFVQSQMAGGGSSGWGSFKICTWTDGTSPGCQPSTGIPITCARGTYSTLPNAIGANYSGDYRRWSGTRWQFYYAFNGTYYNCDQVLVFTP